MILDRLKVLVRPRPGGEAAPPAQPRPPAPPAGDGLVHFAPYTSPKMLSALTSQAALPASQGLP